MKSRSILLGAISVLASPLLSLAANIDKATLTEVVNSVSVIDRATKKAAPAKSQQLFTAPNVLRTGADSRAEMVAEDKTVTRVGQNTLFSFQPDSREIELQKGSILFQSPSGQGGGTIRTAAASAAVLGTTLIVTATKNGGFKVLLVEGKGRVKAGDGSVRTLKGGELVYALPGGKLSGVFEFRLSQQVGASNLVRGFKKPLPSAAKIQAAIKAQEKDIASGKATPTNLLASGSPNFAIQVDVVQGVQTGGADEQPTGSPLELAQQSDAIILQPDLETARIFNFGAFTPSFVDPKSGDAEVPPTTTAFVGQNVIFDSASVDLTPYATGGLFAFFANDTLRLEQSVDFGTTANPVMFFAGRTIEAQPGTAITIDAPFFYMASLGLDAGTAGPDNLSTQLPGAVPMRLEGFSLTNNGGGIGVFAPQAEFVNSRFLAAGPLSVDSAIDLIFDSPSGNLPSFAASAPNAPQGFNVAASKSFVNLHATRDVLARRLAVTAPQMRITSERDIKLSTVQLDDKTVARNLGGGSVGSINEPFNPGVTIAAANFVGLNSVNFHANDVLVQGRTIALSDVKFRLGSRVYLESALGVLAANPNQGRPVEPGKVNFLSNVKYGNVNAQSAVIQNGAAPTNPSQPGIVVRPRLNSR